MTDNVDNLVLEQLKAIRERLDTIESGMTKMSSKIDDGNQSVQGLTMIMTMLAGHVHQIETRLESVEAKIGGA